MARIPEGEVERMKREVSIQRLVESRGVVLKRHGADWIGHCPFHQDKTPSLVVSPGKNLWHCLGACQTGGSVIDFVMKSEGVSFRHAVELLREGAELRGASWGGKAAKKSTSQKMPGLLTPSAEDQELLNQVIEYYHQTLKQSPEALGYLEGRGLQSAEMVEHFKLGFANRTLGYRLPMRNRVEGAGLRSRLQDLGILRKSGHEHFNGSVVIPILDENGQVVEAYGRKITSFLRKGTPDHLYLPGPHRGVWNLQVFEASEEIILCEALIDGLTFWCAGFRNVTAIYGIEGFTWDHLKAFEQYGIKRVLIAYDRDEAGDRAAEAVSKKLIAKGIECCRIQFPKGMDANEYALKVQPAQKSLDVAIRKALWLGKGKEPERTSMPDCCVVSESASESKPLPEAAEREKSGEPANEFLPLAAETKPQASEPMPTEPEELLPEPVMSKPAVSTERKDHEVVIQLGDRRYRARGLQKNLSFEQMRVNLLAARLEDPSVSNNTTSFHVDTLDLYSAKQRSVYIKQAAEELGIREEIIKNDLGNVLLKLEELQEEQIKSKLAPKSKEMTLTKEEQASALDLLKDPNLLDRILADFEKCGIVGEETNKLTGYLAAVSRKLEEPLAVVIQSSSAAGKTSLMDAVLAFMPEEERVQYSAMTGQSLFYMGETDLKHKILAIVEEEGAERASYALKLLQSEGQLTIASTGKDPDTGRLVTHEYHVEGPVMIFLTTTAIEIDEELLNRCIVLSVSEDREQTKRIHRLQRSRQTLEGLLARQDRQELLKAHQNAQRMLRPLLVVNPYAPSLTFADNQIRTRRDHMKYLTLIRSIALLHQYQRPRKSAKHKGKTVTYIEVSREDIETANRLAHEVLGRSLDELPPQTRRLLTLLDEMVTEACKKQQIDRCDYHFTRRTVREHTGMGNTQLKIHLGRLVDLEYLVVHPKSQTYYYELVYDGRGELKRSVLMGLIDTKKLEKHAYDGNRSGLGGNRSGQNGEKSGTGRPVVGAWSGGGRGSERPEKRNGEKELEPDGGETVKNAVKRGKNPDPSYVIIDRKDKYPLAAKEGAC